MRASAALLHSSPVTKSATSETAAAEETFSPPVTLQQSRWHSPVPYLFGGLAAVLGLIVFALLILACSYWKVGGERNHVEGGKGDGGLDMKASPPFEEKILVIMAGDVRPTFLATPASSHEKLIRHVKDKENENNIDERIPVEIQLNREHVQIWKPFSLSRSLCSISVIGSVNNLRFWRRWWFLSTAIVEYNKYDIKLQLSGSEGTCRN